METWVFALVVLGVGALLAFTVDSMRRYYKAGKSNTDIGPKRRERNRWLTYWFTGRFPTSEEERELERDARETDAKARRERKGD